MSEPNGRYDSEATKLLKEVKASGVILIVLDGSKGHGFQVAIDKSRGDAKAMTRAMARMLRDVATQIEKDGGTDTGHLN